MQKLNKMILKLSFRYMNGTLPKFDVMVSFSSIEHSGLGRYGDELNPWGDLVSHNRKPQSVLSCPKHHFLTTGKINDRISTDLQIAMAQTWCMTVKDAKAIVGVPTIRSATGNVWQDHAA